MKNKKLLNIALLPSLIWLSIFFIVPFIIIFVYSFFERGTYGEVMYRFNLENYTTIVDFLYLKAFSRTLLLALFNVFISLVIAYPVAYFIAFKTSTRVQNILLLAIILPFWTNYLARIYSWLMLLGDKGIINNTLIGLGIISEPISMIFSPFAILIGLTYNYLPFMILSLYVSLEGLDKRLMKAAADLGATKLQVFTKVTLPLSIRGIINGSVLIFAFSIADYVIPNLLGGSKYLLISNVIANQFVFTRNVPFGAALTIVFTFIVLLIIIIQNNSLKRIINE